MQGWRTRMFFLLQEALFAKDKEEIDRELSALLLLDKTQKICIK